MSEGTFAAMNEDQLNEVLSWIRDDRLKLAVLESQFKQSQEAQREMLAEVKSLRQQIKADVTEIVANCRAVQGAKEKSEKAEAEAAVAKTKDAADSTAIINTFKYIGAAIAGGAAAIAAWIKSGGN